MSTSSNQSSPNTPRWRPFKTILGDLNWIDNRQSQELWRAALTDRGGQLEAELSNPLLATASAIADQKPLPGSAMREFDQAVTEQYASGLTLDMAKRALARACATDSGAAGFASELVAEAASYFASRDLHSYVAAPGRVNTTTDSIALKDSLRRIAREAAQSAGTVRTDPVGWRAYVSEVLAALQRSST